MIRDKMEQVNFDKVLQVSWGRMVQSGHSAGGNSVFFQEVN